MTTTTYCGITFDLITGDELSEVVDQLNDAWGPNWKDDPTKRLALDTLNSCQHFIDHYEDAARVKAFADGSAAVRSGVGDLLKDMAPGVDLADLCRKTGAL